VIRSFRDRETEAIFQRCVSKALGPEVSRIGYRKLVMLDAADSLRDLRIPPGNRLEKLRGDREGQHAIKLNKQWRICFRWTEAGAENVEIVDYHKRR
jgi:toxin HigB-1